MWHPTKREEAPSMKLGMVGDGTYLGTKIIDRETGREVEDVLDIDFSAALNSAPTLIIKLRMPMEWPVKAKEGHAPETRPA
jgi:hypothetical protein